MEKKVWVPLLVAGLLILAVFGLGFYLKKHPNSITVRFMSRVAIFTAMATILYVVPIFQFKLPFFPPFLEVHLDEVPSMIAGFAFGPWVAISTVFLKTIIKLPFSSTMMVGELTDFLLGTLYVGLTSLIFAKKRNLLGASLGIGIATVVQVVLAMVLNVYVMIPFYTTLMGFTEEGLLEMMQGAVPAIQDVGWSYALFGVLPFNLFKDALVIVLTLVCYKMLAVYLEKMHRQCANGKGGRAPCPRKEEAPKETKESE